MRWGRSSQGPPSPVTGSPVTGRKAKSYARPMSHNGRSNRWLTWTPSRPAGTSVSRASEAAGHLGELARVPPLEGGGPDDSLHARAEGQLVRDVVRREFDRDDEVERSHRMEERQDLSAGLFDRLSERFPALRRLLHGSDSFGGPVHQDDVRRHGGPARGRCIPYKTVREAFDGLVHHRS